MSQKGSSDECDTPAEKLHAPQEGEEMTGKDPSEQEAWRANPKEQTALVEKK